MTSRVWVVDGVPERVVYRPMRAAVCLVCLLFAARANAQAPVRLDTAPAVPVYVDGWLTEWQGVSFTSVGDDALQYAVASTPSGLAVVARVRDERVVRTARPSASDDAIILTVASPTASGWVATEIFIHPGVEGERAAVVLAGAPNEAPRAVAGARVVEAASRTGYDIEALIPFDALPGAVDLARGRARIRLHDVDGGAPVVSASSAASDPARLPFVVGERGELGTLARFLRERRLDRSAVTVDLRGDVTHDGRAERVVVAGAFVAVFGDGYLDGRGFDFIALGNLGPRGVIGAALLDFEGDGRRELYMTLELVAGAGRRTVARVLDFDASRITTLVELETGYADSRGEVTATLAVEPAAGREPIGLRVRPGTARTLDARTLPIPEAPVLAMPTPWSSVTSRVYRFVDGRFRMVAEERAEAPVAPAATTQTTRPATTSNTQAARPTTTRPVTTQPRPATPAWSADPLIAAFRTERRLGNIAPHATHEGDLAEDARAERVLHIGRSLLVVGPGFLEGQRYFAIDLDVTDPAHVTSITLTDVTNDRQAEILVRMRKAVSATQVFEMLVVYRLSSAGLSRLLVAQVGFSDGAHAVRNEPRVVGSGRSLRFAIAPGTATGWDAASWPFTELAAPAGVAPMLLPWRDREVRYRFDGQTLVRE